MSTDSEVPNNNTTTSIGAYGAYPFSSDEIYQQGLASILAGNTLDANSPPEVREELERRTRVFYFNKITGSSITINEARDYELSLAASTVDSAQPGSQDIDENRVLTFAELKELIESGNVDNIPNNKIIPEALNDAPPSQSTAPTKKKPWEMGSS
ncbi:hypothetical protein BYT27DRAFT_7169151 [Phlegmacium glaucopus]|nr:hypothetical protein BYT27DRAFT_7169151 [Phlegmacium glaucopus]